LFCLAQQINSLAEGPPHPDAVAFSGRVFKLSHGRNRGLKVAGRQFILAQLQGQRFGFLADFGLIIGKAR